MLIIAIPCTFHWEVRGFCINPKDMTFNQLQQWAATSRVRQWIEMMREKNPKLLSKEVNRGPVSNYMYWHLGNEFRNAGLHEFKMYRHFLLNTGQELSEEERFTSQPTVYIHTSISIFSWSIRYTIQNLDRQKRDVVVSFTPRSNRPITEEAVYDFIFKHIEENYLYPPGAYRDCQIVHGWSKEDVKNELRDEINGKIFHNQPDTSVMLRKHYLKRYNVDIGYIYDQDQMNEIHRKVIRATGGRKVKDTMSVIKFNIHNVLESMGDGDIDELENEFYREMDQYPKNAIMI